jgi:methyl-accepting chemotaxis protein
MALGLRRRGLLTKLYLSMGAVALPLLLLQPLYVLPSVRAQLDEERARALRQVVETAYGVLELYEARVRAGELTTEQAQAEAARILQQLRYGDAEYLWVNDLSTRLVMHPHLPTMLGKELTSYRDAKGKAVFSEIVALARARGEGFIFYHATRPGQTKPLPKQSYVKLFPPWGWVLGTGVYLEDVDREASALQWRLLLAVFGGLLLAVAAGTLLARSIARPVQVLVDAARRVERGDLNVSVRIVAEDEVGRLGLAFNTMVVALRETVKGLVDVAISTVAEVDRIRQSAQLLSQASREQSTQLQQVSHAVLEMSRSISQGAEQAQSTAEVAANNGRVAEQGGETVEHASRKISEIVQVVQRSEEMVMRLQASGAVVGQMLRLIQDVSNETSILAVNTAIESARAGEHGKGFSVVANEVRKLAHRSREAVEQIEQLLKRNQEDTTAAVALMQQGTLMVEEGMQLSSATGQALARIVAGAQEIHTHVGQLAANGVRQAASGERLAERLQSISVDVQEAVAGVEQIAQSVSDLHAQAQQLWALAARFSSDAVKKQGS